MERCIIVIIIIKDIYIVQVRRVPQMHYVGREVVKCS